MSSFSPCGELFVCINDDGILTMWDTSSNKVKQEFNLKSHSSTTCSSLAWASFHNSSGDEVREVQILVIGTYRGSIFLYDYSSGKLYNHFVAGHSDEVNDLCFDSETNYLFSCSSDKSVIVWNTNTGQINQKWIAGDGKIYSLHLIDSNNILTGSNSILWWNVKEQTIVKKFSFNKTPVTTLNVMRSMDASSSSYFMSASSEETKISAWSLNEKGGKNAVASFVLPSEPQHIDISKSFSKENPLHLVVVTKSGNLLLFEHVLNGKTKNLMPQMTLQIISKPVKTDKQSTPIPIIASKVLDAAESCIIAYGYKENPIFESVNIFDCPKSLTLLRHEPVPKKIFDGSQPKVKLCNTFYDSIMANGRTSPVSSPYNSPKKKKIRDANIEHLHISQTETIETLNNSSVNSRVSPSSSPSVKKKKLFKTQLKELQLSKDDLNKPVETDPSKMLDCLLRGIEEERSNLINLKELQLSKDDLNKPVETDPSKMLDCLLRGIEEERSNLINMVLHCDNSELVRSIVKNIPLQSLNSILIELHRRLILQEKRYSSNLIKWLKEILEIHLPYIKTCSELTSIVNKLIELLDASNISQTLVKMHMLKGLLRIQLQNLSEDSESCSSEDDSENDMVST